MPYQFDDLLPDIELLEQDMAILSDLVGVALTIIDTNRRIVCTAGWRDIYRQFHTDRFTVASSAHSDVGLRCVNGLMEYCVPVMFDQQQVASIIADQFLLEPPDEAYFRHRARHLGYDVDEYLAAVHAVPIMPEDFPDRIASVLTRFASIVVLFGRKHTQHLEAIEKLERNEERFKALADYAYDMECWIGEDGQLLWVNPAIERTVGYTVDEAFAMTEFPLQLVDKDDRSIAEEQMQGMLLHGTSGSDFEVRLRHKDGRVVWSSTSWQPIFDRHGHRRGYRASTRDITERKLAEEELRRLQKTAEARAVMLDTVNNVANEILSSHTGQEALQSIAETAHLLTNARYAGIFIVDATTLNLPHLVTAGDISRREQQMLQSMQSGDQPGGILRVALRSQDTIIGEIFISSDDRRETLARKDTEILHELGRYAALIIHDAVMTSRERALMRAIIAAHEAERRAIAYDLHDGLTQFVMASHAHIEAFKQAMADGNTEKSERDLNKGLSYLKEAVIESRHLINNTRTLILDDLGLAEAIEHLLLEEKTRVGWSTATFQHNLSGQRFDKLLETAIYRVAQEAITNIHKHAASERVQVTLRLDLDHASGQQQLILEVQDWGVGFNFSEKADDPLQVGLHSMLERAILMGGTCKVDTTPGKGTRIRAVFPIN